MIFLTGMRALARNHLNVFVQSLHLATVFGDLPPASTERRLEVCATVSWLPFPNYRYGREHFPNTRAASRIVLESGHANAEDAARLAQGRLDQSRALAGLTFANKKLRAVRPVAKPVTSAVTIWRRFIRIYV
jgi:hypothetical protein